MDNIDLLRLQQEAYENNLTELNLAGCGLTAIPDWVYTLTNLEKLVLGRWQPHEKPNQIDELPDEILKLRKLTSINLQGNRLRKLPTNFWKLSNIKYLYLDDNLITEFPAEIAMLPSLQYVSLYGNPIQNIPLEIAYKSLGTIQNYFKSVVGSDGIDFLYEIKLLIVGEERAGKTTLSKLLRGETINLNEKSTEGIDINRMVMSNKMLVSNQYIINDDNKNNYYINIWDFGGQEIYHATHQFFLTKRSLYLFVMESRKDDNNNEIAFYWLNTIQTLANMSPVIVVTTKCDSTPREIPIQLLEERFNNIYHFAKVSCLPEYSETVEDLKKKIFQLISSNYIFPHLGTPLPKVWIEIRKELEVFRLKNLNYISKDDYYQLCKKYYIEQKQAELLIEFLHDIGVVLYFSDDINLSDTVFLNHEWVTKGVYSVLDCPEIVDNKGLFYNDDLHNIWKDETYRTKAKELLSLMKCKKFELCFEINTGKGSSAYLAPQLLSSNIPEFDLKKYKCLDDSMLKYEFKYKFMPKGIISRFIVKQHSKIADNIYWRNGVMIEFDNTCAIIQEKYFERKIEVQLHGSNKKGLLDTIRSCIYEIHSYFSSINFDEIIFCNCTSCTKDDEPHQYNASVLRRHIEDGVKDIYCYKSYKQIPIHQLLNGILSFERQNDGKIIYNFYGSVDRSILGDSGYLTI